MVEIIILATNECVNSNGGCYYQCHDSLLGLYCTCPDGSKLAQDQLNCEGLEGIF